MGTEEESEPLPAEAPCRVHRGLAGLAWLSPGATAVSASEVRCQMGICVSRREKPWKRCGFHQNHRGLPDQAALSRTSVYLGPEDTQDW